MMPQFLVTENESRLQMEEAVQGSSWERKGLFDQKDLFFRGVGHLGQAVMKRKVIKVMSQRRRKEVSV